MKLIPVSVAYFIVVILIAHFLPPAGYVWIQNTVSELASQGHVHKWVMQLGFIGFGVLLAGGLAWEWRGQGNVNWPEVPIVLYALSILVTGFFCVAPIDSSLNYSFKEAQIHSHFATIAGFALVTGILWHMIVVPEKRAFHLTFLLLVTGISMLFGLSESGMISVGKGILQRTLYIVSFVWLWFLM